jgi:acetyl-CoA carboxylase carboxyltransferase component
VANLGVRSHLEENKHNRIRPEQPLYDINELNGIIPVDHKKPLDMH